MADDAVPASSIECDAGTQVERRQSPRTSTIAEIGLRRMGSFNFQVRLLDLSTDGCKVELIELAAPTDPVIARLPNLEPLGGKISWTQGTIAGLHFHKRIHPAVFNLLLKRLA